MPPLVVQRAAILALLCGPLYVAADSITLRALEVPDGQLDDYIATQAYPMELRNSIEALAPTATPRQVIRRYCGDVRPTYLKRFLAANALKETALDQPAPDDRELIWPACIFARDYRNGPQEVITAGPKDSLWSLHLRFTGRKKFADSGFFYLNPDQATRKLSDGESLRISYFTQPTTIRLKVEQQEFLAGLTGVAGKGWQERLAVLPPFYGRILTAFGAAANDASTRRCTPSTIPPFAGEAVLKTYLFALGKRSPSTANVYIVDNGFFGADPRNGSDAAFRDSAFEQRYFRLAGGNSNSQLIASTTNLTSKDTIDEDLENDVHLIQPVNYMHFLQPSEVSGHGTHVAGLAIGGPYFKAQRENMPRIGGDGLPWVQLTVVNVGKGGENLLPNAHREIFNVLVLSKDVPLIVNMSLVYEDNKVRSTFEEMVRLSNKGTLFVVAAGNSGLPVPDAWLPATQGGKRSEPVITVAALDGNGRIAPFSSYSNDYVDIAAPGCALKSWIANDGKEVELSGTSMATPLVTFVASLLRSLRSEADAKLLKARLIAAGNLLAREDRDRTISKVALNAVNALYVDWDYLRTDDGEFLGEVMSMPRASTQCGPNREQRSLAGIWAFKRHESGALIHYGREAGSVIGNCDVQDSSKGEVQFTASHRIEAGQFIALPRQISLTPALSKVQEIVFRMP